MIQPRPRPIAPVRSDFETFKLRPFIPRILSQDFHVSVESARCQRLSVYHHCKHVHECQWRCEPCVVECTSAGLSVRVVFHRSRDRNLLPVFDESASNPGKLSESLHKKSDHKATPFRISFPFACASGMECPCTPRLQTSRRKSPKEFKNLIRCKTYSND